MSDGKPPQPRIVGSAKDVADKIRRAKKGDGLGKVIFLIGAGCSISAGVPGAPEIARIMVKEIAQQYELSSEGDDCVKAYRALVSEHRLKDAGGGVPLSEQFDKNIDWYRVYDEMFETYYDTREYTRDLFEKIIEDTNGAINWAHLCLGEIVARRFVSTVLTTNFDQLVLSGMVRAGVLPVVCDGIESLNRIAPTPRHPQLIELHGSRHTYVLRNRPDDVKKFGEDPIASGAIQNLIQDARTFVVVGYAGREEGVMNLLIRAARVFDDKNIFWVQYSKDPNALSDHAAEFLATTRNGGLLVGRDADVFFLELSKALGVGAPRAISDPLKTADQVIENVETSKPRHHDIQSEIAKARENVAIARAALEKHASAEDDVISKIRKSRLAGNHAEAYRLAEEVLAR